MCTCLSHTAAKRVFSFLISLFPNCLPDVFSLCRLLLFLSYTLNDSLNPHLYCASLPSIQSSVCAVFVSFHHPCEVPEAMFDHDSLSDLPHRSHHQSSRASFHHFSNSKCFSKLRGVHCVSCQQWKATLRILYIKSTHSAVRLPLRNKLGYVSSPDVDICKLGLEFKIKSFYSVIYRQKWDS